ncbi:TOM1-like protein 2 isoform X1 [Anguilla rostrata]|uniref:TOM1-like protein 2 isoform X1 n=1 Tax=Anguilla rostrata TaxID=7938 RepID=UPI0030D3B65D
MEFLLGNPYSTPVGQCIEKATDGSLQSEDWALNMEICDIINETEDGPKDAIKAVKKRLHGNRNFKEVMLGLTVLETCVKNCGHRFHILVANRDFIDGVLVKIISPKTNPPTIVQDKVLSLIQAWADAFRSSPDLTGVVHIYEELKRKGVEFPMAELDVLSPIHTPQRLGGVQNTREVDPAVPKYTPPSQPYSGPAPPASSTVPPTYSAPQIPSLQGVGAINPSPDQIIRLRSELEIVRGNTKVMSEMLTEMVPGQEHPSDHELLQELNRTCRAMQQRIVELISRVANEEVTEELLHVNDDLNNIFLRYERYERYRTSRAAQNTNNGVLSEATEDNLIDLGPGSPAVVSPKVSAPPAPAAPAAAVAPVALVAPAASTASAPPAASSTPAALSTQLAGLDVGTDSVSGALKSLPSCKPQDAFDMFAQNRTGSQPDQLKSVKQEEFQARGGIASGPDTKQQSAGGLRVKDDNADMEPIDSWLITQGMIPVAQSSVMDDIEEWLCTDVKGDEVEEGVTSEEFDKFLEERAKAAEMVPTLPSPPSGDPAPPVSVPSGSRKKPQRSEDALFAL